MAGALELGDQGNVRNAREAGEVFGGWAVVMVSCWANLIIVVIEIGSFSHLDMDALHIWTWRRRPAWGTETGRTGKGLRKWAWQASEAAGSSVVTSCRYGACGQLGSVDKIKRLVLVWVESEGASRQSGELIVSCVDVHTMSVTEEGGLWSWGKGWGWRGRLESRTRQASDDEGG